jgi:hypothetical protein
MSTVLNFAGYTGNLTIHIEDGSVRIVGAPEAVAAAAAPKPPAAPRKKAPSKRARSEVEGLIADQPDIERIERAKFERKIAARVDALRKIKAVRATAEQAAAGVEVQGLAQGTTLRLAYAPDVRIHYVLANQSGQYDTHTECHEKNTLGKAVSVKTETGTESGVAAGGGGGYTTAPQRALGGDFSTHLMAPGGDVAGDVLIKHMGNDFSEMNLEHIIITDGHRGKKLGRVLLRDAMAAAVDDYPAHHNGTHARTFGLKHLSLAAEAAHRLYTTVPSGFGFQLTDVVVYPWRNDYGAYYAQGRSARMLEYLYERRPAQAL